MIQSHASAAGTVGYDSGSAFVAAFANSETLAQASTLEPEALEDGALALALPLPLPLALGVMGAELDDPGAEY